MGDTAPNASTEELARVFREQLLLPHYAQAIENSVIETKAIAAVLQAAYRAHQHNTSDTHVQGLRVLLTCADDGLRDAHEHMEEMDAMARHAQAAHDHTKAQLQELQTTHKERVKELEERIAQVLENQAKTNSEAMTTIGGLTKTYQELLQSTTAQIAEKNERIAELTHAVGMNNPSATPHHPHPPRRKTTDPETFTPGQDSVEKRQQKYEAWAAKVDAVLLQDAAYFPTDRDRQIYICGLLGGTAFEFIKEGLKTVTDNPDEPTKWTWKTAKDLRTALDNRYILVDSAQIARNKLDDKKSWQGNRQYQEWKSELDDLLHRARQTEEQKVAGLKKRINPELSGKVAGVPDQPPIDDYAAWSDFVGKLARNLVDQKHTDRLQPRMDHVSHHATKNAQPADPMDLDRVDHSIAHISQEERDYRFNNKLCIACGQPGHYSAAHRGPNALPMPPRSGSPNPRASRGHSGGRGGYGRGYNGHANYQQPQNYQPRPPARQYLGPQFSRPQLRALSPAGYVLSEDTSTTTSFDQGEPSSPKDTPLA